MPPKKKGAPSPPQDQRGAGGVKAKGGAKPPAKKTGQKKAIKKKGIEETAATIVEEGIEEEVEPALVSNETASITEAASTIPEGESVPDQAEHSQAEEAESASLETAGRVAAGAEPNGAPQVALNEASGDLAVPVVSSQAEPVEISENDLQALLPKLKSAERQVRMQGGNAPDFGELQSVEAAVVAALQHLDPAMTQPAVAALLEAGW